MQRVSLSFLLILISCLLFAGDAPIKNNLGLKTVVIDAGHGGKDPGALGKHSQEKNITLAVALKVGNAIKAGFPDVKIIYTRSTDVFVELNKRAEIANKNHADLFISIHVNSNTNANASGVDTWVLGQYKSNENLQVAKTENKVILAENNYNSQYEGFDPTSAESYIIFNLMQNTFIGQSLDFATEVQKQVVTVGRKDRGVESAPFLVLWKTTMPSVLVETGFISNADEEKILTTEEGQDSIATAIFRAFAEYKHKVDSKTKVAVFNDSKKQTEGTKPQTTKTDSISFSNKMTQAKQEKPIVSNIKIEKQTTKSDVTRTQDKDTTKQTSITNNTNSQTKVISKEFPKPTQTSNVVAKLDKEEQPVVKSNSTTVTQTPTTVKKTEPIQTSKPTVTASNISATPKPTITTTQPNKVIPTHQPTVTQKTETKDSSIYFSVQILSSAKRIKRDSIIFKGVTNLEEIKLNGAYKYLVGKETDFNKIVPLKNKTREIFPDAFVVATKNGIRIPITEAIEASKKK